VRLFSILGRDNQVNSASRFRGGEITSVMGESVLDLRQATIPPGEEAVLDVFTMMGGLVIRVPAEWMVDVQAVPVMGGIKDQRVGRVEAGTTTPPRLVVRGSLMMGGLSIR
jgi:predicted membrane protein